MALAAVVLTVAIGFCLFDTGAHGAGQDLCLSLLAMPLATLPGFLMAAGSLLLPCLTPYRLCPPDLPAPPPKA